MNKKVIIIGVVSALLIGGGVFWWMRGKKKAQAEEEAKKKAEEEAAAKAAEEAAAREKELSNKATQSTPKETYPATPFKSKEEGNAFRAWVNKNKPDWRLKGDVLAPTGEFDNTTIRAAYKEFGAAYQTELKKLVEEKKSSDLKEELKKFAGKRFVANKPTNAFTSEYLTKPFIFGGTDGKGNIGKGIYAGVLRDLKKDPLSGKIVAQLENVSSYMKATDGTAVFKFWVDYKTIFPA